MKVVRKVSNFKVIEKVKESFFKSIKIAKDLN